jgi:surface carbohydrate biosynthesis protein
MGNALIAHHLRRFGVIPHLEPINAWQAVLGAHRPDFIVFNHLSVPHLAKYSRRLKEMGVLTAVLPNEGIFYNAPDLEYGSKSENPEMHCDYYFCWNDVHREALVRNKFCSDPERVRTVGIPRFDFYFEPWKRTAPRHRPASGRPVILMCGNFPLAHFQEMPPEEAEHFFAKWLDAVPLTRDYKNIVRGNHAARTRFLDYLDALMRIDKYHIIVRPHPRELGEFYHRWLDKLPAEQRAHVELALDESIANLILNCDLQVSCEHCTTALESWIVGQPTIEIVFEKHPFFYNPKRAGLNIECDAPERLPAMVAEALKQPAPAALKERQQEHLRTWCGPMDGASAKRVARIIADAVKAQPAKAMRLKLSDYRRGWKLLAYGMINQPYTFFPVHLFLEKLSGKKTPTRKTGIYKKSITPSEVREAAALLESCA